MIENKLRGQRVDNNEWVYGYLVKQFGKYKIYDDSKENCKDWIYEVIPETIGRFSGATDKNGIEVYEGDKVKAFNGVDEILGIVKFGNYVQDTSYVINGEFKYSNVKCIGFYIEKLLGLPDELGIEPNYFGTHSLLAYESIEVVSDNYINDIIKKINERK